MSDPGPDFATVSAWRKAWAPYIRGDVKASVDVLLAELLDLRFQLASLTQENERKDEVIADMDRRLLGYVELVAKERSLTQENERLRGSLKMLAQIRHDAEAELASERARAEENYEQGMACLRQLHEAEQRERKLAERLARTIVDKMEAEQRAARYEEALKAIAAGNWNLGNLVPGKRVQEYARQALNPEKEIERPHAD